MPESGRPMYRLVALDGTPHPVLDAPYESVAAAEAAASRWCSGQDDPSPFVSAAWRSRCKPDAVSGARSVIPVLV